MAELKSLISRRRILRSQFARISNWINSNVSDADFTDFKKLEARLDTIKLLYTEFDKTQSQIKEIDETNDDPDMMHMSSLVKNLKTSVTAPIFRHICQTLSITSKVR